VAEDPSSGRDAADWRRLAACRGEDPELFFPISSVGPAQVQITDAKKVCARCPVRPACLRYALATRQDYGIWGGLTEDERRQLRGRPPRPAKAPSR
jgi:WhiB family redox-sensing transcriptional regulator